MGGVVIAATTFGRFRCLRCDLVIGVGTVVSASPALAERAPPASNESFGLGDIYLEMRRGCPPTNSKAESHLRLTTAVLFARHCLNVSQGQNRNVREAGLPGLLTSR